MQTSLVLTVIGPDRPGLVESLARTVAAHGGNWTESRMAELAGQFAGILRVVLPAAQVDALATALQALEADGLRVQIARSQAAGAAAARQLTLDLVGQDRPGIVREIAAALARLGVSIDELHTRVASASMSGETLFEAHARLAVPATLGLADLRGALEALANEMMVDLTLDDVA